MKENRYQEKRERMVKEQIVSRGIRDPRVLQVLKKVPRHLFVEPGDRHQAYEDSPLPVGKGQTISQPYIVALMTEALGLRGGEKVLEIGTGSGYQTAILAELAGSVYTVERIPELQEKARKTLQVLGYRNIEYRVGDGSRGWPDKAPFEGILVTAAAGKIPSELLQQLAENCRMVIPVGDGLLQELILLTREKEGYKQQSLGGCRFVPLIGDSE